MAEESPKKDATLVFSCGNCCTVIYFDSRFDDPTTGSGACKICGSHNWIIDDIIGDMEE